MPSSTWCGSRFQLHAVAERARLALVGVDAHVDRPGMVLGQEGPLQPGGEPGPAAAAEVARADHLHHVGRRLLLEHFVAGVRYPPPAS